MIDSAPAAAPAPAMPGLARATRLLGVAGLLPQLLFVLVEAEAASRDAWGDRVDAMLFALVYASIILSFIGGIWWGFAVRRTAGQGVLAAFAVIPSLIAAPLLLIGFAWGRAGPWMCVAIGSAILLTLLVDRHLASTGEVPAGWMRLRVPLSLGLGTLTILAGILGPA